MEPVTLKAVERAADEIGRALGMAAVELAFGKRAEADRRGRADVLLLVDRPSPAVGCARVVARLMRNVARSRRRWSW
jgi:hypothetical protein